MRRSCFALVIALGIIGPFVQQAFGQARAVDVRAIWGYSYGLDDSPPHALVGGVSVTTALGPHFRLGAELVRANMFGPYGSYKSRARIGRGLLEHELRPGMPPQPVLGRRAGHHGVPRSDPGWVRPRTRGGLGAVGCSRVGGAGEAQSDRRYRHPAVSH